MWTVEQVAAFEEHRDAFLATWRDHGFLAANLEAKRAGVPVEYFMSAWVRMTRVQS